MSKIQLLLALIPLAALQACASTASSRPAAAQSASSLDPNVKTVSAEDLAQTGDIDLAAALRRLVPALH